MTGGRPLVLMTDLERQSYRVAGHFFKALARASGREPLEVATPAGGEERAELGKNHPGAVFFHNTLGFNMIPVPGGLNVALPAHEWSRYPARWIGLLNRFDAVWANSLHVAGVMRTGGLTASLKVQPLPLASEEVPRKASWERNSPVTFLSVGEAHFRKGFHLLIAGFLKAFPEPGRAGLVIKTGPDCSWEPPREDVEIIKTLLPREKLLSLYREHDFYVSASLAEGLGLPVAEAALAGTPLVINHWGGHKDLVTGGGFIPMAHEEILQPFSSNPDYYAEGQTCAYSSPAAVADALLRAEASTAAERRSTAERALAYVKERFSMEAALRIFETNLESLG